MDQTMDLREIVHLIKKRILMIIGITAVCAGAAAVLSFYVLKPVYEAKTSIIVSKQATDTTSTTYNDVLMYQNLIKTYSEIAKSKAVAKLASEKLNNRYSAQAIMSASDVAPQSNTQILTISAVSRSAEDAKDIVEALSQSFIQESAVVYPSSNVIKVIDEAEIPDKPVKPNKSLNIALGLFLGLLLSGGMAFFLEYMDRSIRTEEDVAKYLNDVPVIGIIPKDARR